MTAQRVSFIQAGLGVDSTSYGGFSLGDDDEDAITAVFAAGYFVTDRWVWSIPTLSFAYRGGEVGGLEWVPFAGLTRWGVGYSSIEGTILIGELGAGVATRWWLGRNATLNGNAQFHSPMRWASDSISANTGPDSWRAQASLGISRRVGSSVTFNLAGAGGQWLLVDGGLAASSTERETTLSIGSVQSVGFMHLPLVRWQVKPSFSLDAYAAVSWNLAAERVTKTLIGGATWLL